MKAALPNRVAVYLTAAAALLAGLAPAVAGLDLTGTIGIVAGLGAILAVVIKWLSGWQAYEQDARFEKLHLQGQGGPPPTV